MLAMLAALVSLGRAREGVTALEYGLIAAVIGGVVITGANFMGTGLGDAFNTIAGALNLADTPTP